MSPFIGLPIIFFLSLRPTADAGAQSALDLVDIPAAMLTTGDPLGDENEIRRREPIAGFRLMRFEATNAQFRAFVAASGYLTDPEASGFGYVWDGKWRRVAGAIWRRPHGPASTIDALDRHPVVQISQQDAAAFCQYHGMRLPTEDEWELAARGPDRQRYPWGETPPQNFLTRPANFGTVTCCAADDGDGYYFTAPVGHYPAGKSPFGVHDMAGNVWEWTSSRFPGQPDRVSLRGGGWGNNPYCLRTAYRHANPPDIGLNMVGFRCAADHE